MINKNYLGKRKIKNIIKDSFFPDICIISGSYSKEDNLERITCFCNPYFFGFFFDLQRNVLLHIYDENVDINYIFHLSPDFKVTNSKELNFLHLINITYCHNSR